MASITAKKMGEQSKKKARQYDYDVLAKKAIKEYKKLLTLKNSSL